MERVSLVCMESRCGDLPGNTARINGFIAEAGRHGAGLVVFPELALSGYCLKHGVDNGVAVDSSIIVQLQQAALDAGVIALVGAIEQAAGRFFDTQFVLGLERVQGYRKTHLGSREAAVFAAGDQLPVFGPQGNQFGIGICYDLHFPEVCSTMRSRGAQLITAPHAAPVRAGDREAVWNRYLPARAYDNRIPVLACNLTGSNGCGTDFPGGVAVYGPTGDVLAADFCGAERILTVELPDLQFSGGKDFPAHRRPELYS
jgi:predicted amidohydrolase